ncbi:MAG: WYL domain-containing protein [Alphaproteobacteria bacterium]|nr:WYL domain-containing protein [Alphaproteobacteria bacterium]
MSDDTRNTFVKFKQKLDIIEAMRYGTTKRQIKNIISHYADKDEVNDRTVKREIDSLRDFYSNELIVDNGGAKKEYEDTIYKLELCDFPVDSLEEKDIVALESAVKILKRYNDVSENLKSLLNKLKTKWRSYLNNHQSKNPDRIIGDAEEKASLNFVHTGPVAKIEIDDKVQQTLAEAIFHQKVVSFDYYNKPLKELVCPLGFLQGNNNKYLVAADIITDEKGFHTANLNNTHIRKYKLPHISNAKNTQESYILTKDFTMESYANSMFGTYNDGKKCNIEWVVPKIAPNGKPAPMAEIKRYTFHPTQKITENDDGSLKITFKAGDLTAIARYLFGWGGIIVPVAPKELIDTYNDMLNTCINTIKKKSKK